MRLSNTSVSYGLVTRILHWLVGLGVIGTLVFGTIIGRMRFTPENLWIYQIHKSIGLTLLVLVVLRILWNRTSPKPVDLPMGRLQTYAAHGVHALLYALMIAVPVSGWIASAASGFDTVIWGVTIPRVTPISQDLEHLFFDIHEWLTKTMIVLILLHIGGALTHRGALGRMLGGTSA